MRRHLVLSSEHARHPFRASLPARALQPGLAWPGARQRARAIVVKDDEQDWKLFLLSFIAFFTAISGFIA